MNPTRQFISALILCPLALLPAQLQVIPDAAPECVFAGEARTIAVTFRNSSNQNFEAGIRARIIQTSSATTAQLSETPWKDLQVLPRQTVLESAQLDFPAVKAATKLLVQWIGRTNQVLGKTEVLVYPTNLLDELKPLLGEEVLGVLDPNNELKPLLTQNGVGFLDLAETALADFRGKLAVIGPFESKSQMREGLAQSIQRIASKGVAVVWLQPPPDPKVEIKPSFYSVMENTNAVVVVQADLISRLPENPQAQVNLIYFCKLALQPEPFHLPSPTTQP